MLRKCVRERDFMSSLSRARTVGGIHRDSISWAMVQAVSPRKNHSHTRTRVRTYIYSTASCQCQIYPGAKCERAPCFMSSSLQRRTPAECDGIRIQSIALVVCGFDRRRRRFVFRCCGHVHFECQDVYSMQDFVRATR